MEFTSTELTAIAIAAFSVGFLKSTFSTGIGLFLVPLMIFVWPTRFVLGIISVMMWVTDFLAIPLFWKQWEGRLIRLIVPGFWIGIVIGTYFLVNMPDFWLRKAIGVACIAFTLLQAWREFQEPPPPPPLGRAAGFGIGVGGGIISAMFHSGGMVLTLLFLSQGLQKTAIVATTLATWFWVNPVKVFSFWTGGIVKTEMFLAGVAFFPLAFAGSWVGRQALRAIPQRGFTLAILALSGIAALRLLLEG